MRILRRFWFCFTASAYMILYRRAEKWLGLDASQLSAGEPELLAETGLRDAAALGEKVHEALTLINRHDPRRFAQLLQDFDRVMIVALDAARAAHFWESRTCFIAARRVSELGASAIAVILVSEAARARLFRAGVRPYADLRHRIECRRAREEVAFVKRLPADTFASVEDWIALRLRSCNGSSGQIP